jgi:hypothetical protein
MRSRALRIIEHLNDVEWPDFSNGHRPSSDAVLRIAI